MQQTTPHASDFTVAIIAAALVVAISSYPLYSITRQALSSKPSPKQSETLYEDKDGVATAESEKASLRVLPSIGLLIVSLLGVAASAFFLAGSYIGLLCFLTGDSDSCQRRHDSIWIEQCFVLAPWVLIFIQALSVAGTREYVKRFRLGWFGSASSLVLAISLLIEAVQWNSRGHTHAAAHLHVTLLFIEFLLALAMALCFLTFPRRPNVYYHGRIVDRQFTVSAINRLTFSWATPVLAMAARTKNITYTDLPEVAYEARSQGLRSDFNQVKKKRQFWLALFLSHRKFFLIQWGLQIVQAFTLFLPQIALYAVLRALEARDAGEGNRLMLWLLVISLGASDALSSWAENLMFFISFVKIGTRVYEQISSVVFTKAIRKKDVKGAAMDAVEDEAANGDGKTTAPAEDEEESVAKTRQSTINLIGVDAKRIADFSTFNCVLLGCVAKLLIAIFLLVALIGWIPVLAGFGAFGALLPLNFWVSKRYTQQQDDLMKFRDRKMAVVTEALQGIRQIKFSALEKDWYEKIMETRKKELGAQWRVYLWDTILITIWILGPVALSAIALTVYALIHNGLSPSTAFTTVAIFESIEVTLAVAPELITNLFDALVSCRRIQEFLDSDDRVDYLKEGPSIEFTDATISWPADEKHADKNADRFKLNNLNISFPSGELSVISGRTGSGKSLLLSSLIGEADVESGSIQIPRAPTLSERFDSKANSKNWILNDAIAYVAQIPWIENATIKDNILFSLPCDEARYKKVLHASALEKDLEILPDGDMTDIGANGINLSGGQKWRVSFARALYSRAGILILDDIFSAVDAHVGRQLFEEALTGELGQGRTRILVTHHVALCLPKTTYSVLLENGTVRQAGLTDELRRNGLLKDILAYDIEEQAKEEQEADKETAVMIDDGGNLTRIMSPKVSRPRQGSSAAIPEESLTRTKTTTSIVQEPAKKFTEDEKRETGSVKFAIYKAYIVASGGISYWSLIIITFLVWSGSYLGRTYWVSVWTRQGHTESVSTMALLPNPAHHYLRLKDRFQSLEVDHTVYYYVGIYLGISIAQTIVGTLKFFFVYVASITASRKMFEKLAYTTLRAPLRFLDTTPVGRILNRFTADFNTLDSKISGDLMFLLHSLVTALAVIVAGVFISPLMLVLAAILLTACFWFAMRYLAGAREIKRLESNAKSPVFEQFGSVLTGIGTIRAFDKAEEYVDRMDKKINTHCQAYYHLWLFNRWMSLRVSWVGALFITAMAALIVGFANIDAPLAGFALSFSLQLSGNIIWLLRQYANVEIDLNAVERVVEYSVMPIEDQSGHDAPAAWPTKGEVEVNDLVVSYAPDLPPVLRGLNFSVKQNERIGVVGRTGAGKSSLTLALFRFLDATSGSIWVDGIDISKIKLSDLRSRLAIIPQDPVLFSGTVRSNLDAFDQHSDAELRDALARVQLISESSTGASGAATPSNVAGSSGSSTLGQNTSNVNLFSSLNSKISEGGLNLSQGQRQLLCLARAIVSRPKVLVLDEATSSVDMETDALIQHSIREEFTDSTLIVIAHRLSTIADFNRILVLGEGKVLEFDSPEALMAKENSAFRDMVESSGERRELEAVIKAKNGN